MKMCVFVRIREKKGRKRGKEERIKERYGVVCEERKGAKRECKKLK